MKEFDNRKKTHKKSPVSSTEVKDLDNMKESISESRCLDVLKNIYSKQCTQSLSPLFNAYDDYIAYTVMYFVIKSVFIKRNQNSNEILTQIAMVNIDLCHGLKMLYDLGFNIIPDFFHPARTVHKSWKINLGTII